MIDPKIIRAISGYTHTNYEHTVEYAKDLLQIQTGRDIEQQLKRYDPNEDEALHKIYGMIRILSCKEEDTLDDIMELFNNAGIKL